MKTGRKGSLILGLILTGSAAAAERKPVLTIQVNNLAEVGRMTLVQAEETATGIFQKTGVESRWIEPAAGESFPLSHIQLKILPSLMSIGFGLPDNALGLAPGSGPDRQSVYVSYNKVQALAAKHFADTHADAAQILGHAIAHEIGHLLLNDQSHSPSGIMRAIGISGICGTPAMDICFSRPSRPKRFEKRHAGDGRPGTFVQLQPYLVCGEVRS